MLSHRTTRQRGFTLIELVVVIVIIGILAAFAIPRFAGLAKDARVSALNGVAGALRSSSALIHGMALARNVVNDNPSTGLISLEGQNIDIVNGYAEASADGIAKAIGNLDTANYTVTHAGGVTSVTIVGASAAATCFVTYTQPANPGDPAIISPTTTSGC